MLPELSRLYQAALEDQRARRNEVGNGYQTDEEREGLEHIAKEVDDAYRMLATAWEIDTLNQMLA